MLCTRSYSVHVFFFVFLLFFLFFYFFLFIVFFFNDTATTEIYTLSLHDALPICYEPSETKILFERAEQELAAVPGVTSVSAGMVPVLAGSNWGTNVRVEGFESGPDIDSNSR